MVAGDTVEVVDRYAEPQPTPSAPAFDAQQLLAKAGELARSVLGIYGSMWAATGVPHAYDDFEGEAPCCIVCWLERLAEVHVTAGWPRLQRDRSEDDD